MINAITVDVEDWFHVTRFNGLIKESDLPLLESRLVANVCHILKIFKEFDIKATFFVLGWVAENYPELVWSIHKYGHEIGSHSYLHKLIYTMAKDEFSSDLKTSLHLLKNIIGYDIYCFRAPSFSINLQSLWVFEVLNQCGIQIDSSLFPVKHSFYGGIHCPSGIFQIPVNNEYLVECPPATVAVAGKNFPIAGGGYFRMFPMWLIAKGVRSLNQKGLPAILYLHPWEIDSMQPRVYAGKINTYLHYNNIEIMESKLKYLLSRFQFSTLGHVTRVINITKCWPQW